MAELDYYTSLPPIAKPRIIIIAFCIFFLSVGKK